MAVKTSRVEGAQAMREKRRVPDTAESLTLSHAELQSDPALNVRLGVRYLKYLKEMFRGRLDFTLMAYNAGPNKLIGGLKARNTDAWHNYVRAVRREYAVLKLEHGESGDWTFASR